MSLAKLVVHLQANYKGLTAGLGIARNDVAKTVAHITDVATQLEKMKGKLNEIAPEYQLLSELSAEFANSTDLAGDAADLLRIKLRYISDTMNVLQGQTERYEQTLTSAVASFQLRLLTDALRRQSQATDTIRRLWHGNSNALIKYNQTASQTTRLHDTMSQPRPMLPQASENRSMVRQQGGGSNAQTLLQVTAIAVQAKSAGVMERAMTRASHAVSTVGEALRSVSSVTAQSVSAMDRFRLAATAPKTDPSLNIVKNGIEKVGDAAAAAVDKLRGMADATIEGIPDTLGQIAKSGAKLSNELDKTSATMSKHISRGQTMSKGLKLLSVVFPFAARAIAPLKSAVDTATAATERGAQKVEAASAVIASGANKARNAQFVLTGTFQKLGGSADLFARGQYHAMLPARLLKREIEGSMRVVRAATTVYNVATAPIHKLSLGAARARADFQMFRQTLPPLTQGLQLGVRAYRTFAHATYLSATAVRPLVAAVVGLTRVSMTTGRALYQVTSVGLRPLVNLTRAATGAVGRFATTVGSSIAKVTGLSIAMGIASKAFGLFGSTTNNTTNIINSRFTAIKNTNTSLFGGLISKAGMAKAGLMGLAVAAVAWGSQTAMATEKNNVVFGTMLHDMEQGAAVVQSLQSTQAAGLFDNQELLDSGRLLFKAGVSAADLAGKTDQLATIATATSTELGDLTRIYQQGANAGSFGLDKINQLAERGIDIYGGLTAATGKSGAELKKMISDGGIGLTEMDAALAHLTEGQGIYAGAMQNVAGTASGMMSQMRNNTQQALGALMGSGLEAFKPILAAGVRFTEGLKTTVVALQPVFSAMFSALYMYSASTWAVMMELAGMAMNFIFGEGAYTFSSITEFLAAMFGAATFIFDNLGTVASYAWKIMQLGALMAFNDIIYFFTDTIPAYLSWFSENWANVFLDAGTIVATVFTNIAKNIGAAMTAIWDFIASGGTAKLEFAFVPLLDGFKATVAELPNVPDRALTELEQQLTAELGTMGAELGGGLQAAMAEAVASIGTNETAALSDAVSGAYDAAEPGAEKVPTDKAKEVENKAVQVRSEEGQKALAGLLRSGMKDEKKTAEKIAADSRDHLARIARNTDTTPKLRTRQFSPG
jgi:tape measure domain-containing protein